MQWMVNHLFWAIFDGNRYFIYLFLLLKKNIYGNSGGGNTAPASPSALTHGSLPQSSLKRWSVNITLFITLMSSQSDNDNDAVSSQTPPPQKKVKRLQKYRHEWEEAYPWLSSVRGEAPGDLYKANCNACRRIFSVSHGGLSDIKQHASGEQHSRNVRSQKNQSVVSQFFMTETSPETDSVCEIMLCSYYLWF